MNITLISASDLPGFQFRNIVGFNSYVFMRVAPSQNNLILLLVDGDLKNYDANNDFGYPISGMYKSLEKADLAGAEGDNYWTNERRIK
ncbi:MAG: hypothetical protein M0Q21_08400 [Ignavibacteriaceae bacterium]|nr:hypothetical protein [Ignavibacteriaceae bacterium]